MKPVYIILRIILFLFCGTPLIAGPGPDPCTIKYSKIEYNYTDISRNGGYREEVKARGVQLKNKKSVIDILFTELEKVSDLEAGFYNESNKFKPIREFGTRSVFGGSFYSGINTKTFLFEERDADYDVEYSYIKRNSELMFLTQIPLASYQCVDTFKYTLQIPSSLRLDYMLSGDTSLLKSWNITSAIKSGYTEWVIVSLPKNRLEDVENEAEGIYSSGKFPSFRLSIVDASSKTGDFTAMNTWYNKLILPQSQLDAQSISVIEDWGKGLAGAPLVKALFDSIKTKISYIAFENGIGAVQPRNVNDVLRNRQGDCKDMSNLLRQSIRHFGIPATVALSSTLTHRYDLDYPSLSSANHVICVTEIDGVTYYLDPTESFCKFGNPSRQIQGRKIFIIDSISGRVVTVPVIAAEKNSVKGIFDFTQNGNALSGRFTYTLKGLSKLELETFKGTRSEVDYNKGIKNFLASHFKNIKIDSITTVENDSVLTISGTAKMENSIVKVNEVSYLSQNMLMYPHSFPKKVAAEERLIFFETMSRDFEFNIAMEQSFKLRPVTEEKFKEKGFAFNYSVAKKTDRELQIRYSYGSESLEVENSNRTAYNDIQEKINKAFNKKIAYE